MTPSGTTFLDDLRLRGLLHQCTDEAALAEHLRTADMTRGGRRAYVGFDPTADSLTIGNLVGIVTLGRWQRSGHTPVVVTGGGTGLIGDPSGKSAERQLLTPERVADNVRNIKKIFSRVLSFAGAANKAEMTDNLDWLGKLSYLDALRDVGKHFSVNMMIQKDSVRERLHNRDQGISYTEFSYMILQSYDYLHLHRALDVTLQMGGSDQWGNIVGGCDLIRRCAGPPNRPVPTDRAAHEARLGEPACQSHSFGLTWPLVTKADGTKFGKTESGAIWLTGASGPDDASPARTSPYQFYQFWLNAADSDVVRFLKTFTFLSLDQIASLERDHAADPGKRIAHRALARHMTEMLHGADEADKAEQATRALFAKPSSDQAEGPFVLPEDLLTSAPTSTHDRKLLDGPGYPLVDLLADSKVASSKTEARTLLKQNSISVNGHTAALDARISTGSLINGNLIALRKGKKHWHLTRWE